MAKGGGMTVFCRLKTFWNGREAMRNVAWLPPSSSHGRSPITSSLLDQRDASQSSSPWLFWTMWHVGHFSLFQTLPLWIMEWNFVLMFLLFSENSLYLVGSSLSTCPVHVAHLQGCNWDPLYFSFLGSILSTLSDICVSVMTYFSLTVFSSWRCHSPGRPDLPSLSIFNSHQLLPFIAPCVLSFLFLHSHCYFLWMGPYHPSPEHFALGSC